MTALYTYYWILGEGNFSIQAPKIDLQLSKQSHGPGSGTSEEYSKSECLNGC